MSIKFKFSSQREYQQEAINAVIDVFKGMESYQDSFVRSSGLNDSFIGTQISDIGYRNCFNIADEQIQKNINDVQMRNNVKKTRFDGTNLSIEMETGTGKTYVYLATIMRLYKEYDISKFIILVPNIAIREGVYKNIEIMSTHLQNIYDVTSFSYKIYNSKTINDVRDFASTPGLNILIMNIDSFNKDSNILNIDNEKLGDQKPISYIEGTNPFVIMDEPQSVEGKSDKAKEAIKRLNPSFIVRYSATHLDRYSMLYSLNPIDAYNQGLVKKIVVKSIVSDEDVNKAYINLKGFKNGNPQLELNVIKGQKTLRKIVTVKNNQRLVDVTNNAVYQDYIIQNWNSDSEYGYVEFSNGEEFVIGQNDVLSEFDQEAFKRQQIIATVQSHLDNEIKLRDKGIKVLSLFFIDKVVNYRDYSKEDQKGKYALWLEEVLEELLEKPRYRKLKEFYDLSNCHNGYFSQDKQKFKDTKGNTLVDVDTYDLIMKDKERLIDVNEPIKFIFSHSALREGWDNPNVFQICTLNETSSESVIKKRQEIGRGLRLCVNQEGEVITDERINELTVVVNESYDEFASRLQEEFVEVLELDNIQKNISYIENLIFAEQKIGLEKAEEILEILVEEKFYQQKGDTLKPTEKLYEYDEAISETKLKFNDVEVDKKVNYVIKQLQVANRLPDVKNKDRQVEVKVNQEVAQSDEFKKLKEILVKKTKYKIEIDSNDLVTAIMNDFSMEEFVHEINTKIVSDKIVDINEEGKMENKRVASSNVNDGSDKRYYNIDIIKEITNRTGVSRLTVIEILIAIKKNYDIDEIFANPQYFVEKMSEKIKDNLQLIINSEKGISYYKTNEKYGDDVFFEATNLYFEEDKITYPKVIKVDEKSLYNYMTCDSSVEEEVQKILAQRQDVLMYLKLPKRFKIETPIGSYNPDWAFVKEDSYKGKVVNFVVESKSTNSGMELRGTENLKIRAAKKHFKEISEDDLKFEGPWKVINFENM